MQKEIYGIKGLLLLTYPLVQIHKLRVQIHELPVQIHEFQNFLINEMSSKQP